MVLVKVPENREEEMLKEFFMQSAFTFEGLDITNKKSNKCLENDLRQFGFPCDKEVYAYYFKGEVMNRIYNLTGDNRYKDDLTFVVIPDFYNPIYKLMMGARWFDDIVSNNAQRELEMMNE